MKKLLPVVLVVMVLAALLVVPVFAQSDVPADAAAALVVPDALAGLIAIGVGFLVTQGLKAVFVKNGLDLSGVAAQITGGVVTSVIAFGNFLLSLVPAAYVEPTSIVLMLVVSIFGVFGLHYSYSALKAKR